MFEEELERLKESFYETYPRVYKYLDANGCNYLLTDSTLKFTNPIYFNDPYDYYIGLVKFDSIPDSMRKKIIKAKYGYNRQQSRVLLKNKNERFKLDTDIKRLHKEALPDELKKNGVSCFSEIGNNLLMWSHYSDSHKGVCIEFDLKALCSSLRKEFRKNMGPGKVIYTNKIEPMDYFENRIDALNKLMLTKSDNWEYEKEIRITLTQIDYKGGKDILVPFNDKVITGIFFGSKMSETDKIRIKELIAKKYSSAKMFEMELDTNSFNLNAKPI